VPTASNTAQLRLTEFSVPDKVVPIDISIAPGAIVEISVDDWIYVTGPNYYQVDLLLDFNDAVASNNLGNQGFLVLEQQSIDLSLQNVWIPQLGCFEDSLLVSTIFNNSSCDTLPVGATLSMEFRDENNNLIATLQRTLSEELGPNTSYSIDHMIPVGPKEIKTTLIYTADANPNNNETTTPVRSRKVITGNYLNDFSTNPSNDEYLSIQSFAFDNTLFYQGSQMLATTGIYEDTTQFQKCPDPLDVINNEYSQGFNMYVRTCLDFSNSVAPKLDFDLVQFRNNQVAQPSPYTSMALIKWKGTSAGQELVYGQPEGEKVHKTYAIPPNFKGELNLSLYTEIGSPFVFSNNDLVLDDWQLVDNLQFSGISTVPEISEYSGIELMPNPAQHSVRVQSEEPMTQIRIVDMRGRIVRAMSGNTNIIEIHDLPNGVYLLRVQLDDNREVAEKLVVLRQ
jgi:hypothetical protein